MGLFERLFGKKQNPAPAQPPKPAETRDGKAASPRQLAKWYREGLMYLDRCGPLDEAKLSEFNRMIGGMFSESEIRNFIAQSAMILPSERSQGGTDAVKNGLRETLKEGITTFESLGF